jgi:transposase-like protein
MTRGAAHPAELRAQAVAAVLAGMSIMQAARHFNLSKQTLSRWVAEDGTLGTEQDARDPAETIGDLIFDLITAHVTTIAAQLQAAARPEWLEKQSAAELAQLVAVERDTTLRLLAGLRPVDQQPALDSGVTGAQPAPAADAP